MADAGAAPGVGASRLRLPGHASRQLRDFMRTEAASAGLLVAASVVALVWANSPWSESYASLWSSTLSVNIGDAALSMDLGHWINDGLMALFFFVVGLEVRRELSMGELTDRGRVVVPLLAGVGGMVVPVLLFLALNPSGEAARGWGVVIGTDTAFMLAMLALVGPASSTQLRIFLLTLTVIDDIVAVTVIGVVYADALHAGWLVAAGVLLVVLVSLDRRHVWRTWPYVAALLALWLATLQAGLHASIAGMLAGLLVPAFSPRRSDVEGAEVLFRAFRQSPMPQVGYSAQRGLARAVSVNERLQTVLHPWTSYAIVPVFAFANAGVDLGGGVLSDALQSTLTWGIVVGLVVGKLLGIGFGAYGAVRLGAGELPRGVGIGQVFGGGALSGIGFTVSLLIVGLAFESRELQVQATVGVLLSVVIAAGVGWVVFWLAANLRGERTADLPRLLVPAPDGARDHVRGPADAPLTLVEYLDFECPFCARTTGAAREIREHFGDDLRYVVRHLPLDVHPRAALAAVAVEAAARQGAFWEMHDRLFARQDALEVEELVAHAEDLGLDVEQFVTDLEDPEIERRIADDVASAEASGARATPTFFIGDQRHVGPFDAQSLIRALEDTRRV